jgi:molybdopterin-guanine dinucleotide biosynthesis protein A
MGPERAQITGVVLAGGRGSRMGGADKGLQPYRGVALVRHALDRLASQVGALLINANRNLDAYAAFGVPLCPDRLPDFAGPLAGWHAALGACTTPFLLTVPCDSPLFPLDLAARLGDALAESGKPIAMAAAPEGESARTQPVFCLMRCSVKPLLDAFLARGERKIDRFTAECGCVEVLFADAAAFVNANTAEELKQLPG